MSSWTRGSSIFPPAWRADQDCGDQRQAARSWRSWAGSGSCLIQCGSALKRGGKQTRSLQRHGHRTVAGVWGARRADLRLSQLVGCGACSRAGGGNCHLGLGVPNTRIPATAAWLCRAGTCETGKTTDKRRLSSTGCPHPPQSHPFRLFLFPSPELRFVRSLRAGSPARDSLLLPTGPREPRAEASVVCCACVCVCASACVCDVHACCVSGCVLCVACAWGRPDGQTALVCTAPAERPDAPSLDAPWRAAAGDPSQEVSCLCPGFTLLEVGTEHPKMCCWAD